MKKLVFTFVVICGLISSSLSITSNAASDSLVKDENGNAIDVVKLRAVMNFQTTRNQKAIDEFLKQVDSEKSTSRKNISIKSNIL